MQSVGDDGVTLTTGIGSTVTVIVDVLEQPLAVVTTTEYVVVAVGVATGFCIVALDKDTDGDQLYVKESVPVNFIFGRCILVFVSELFPQTPDASAL